MSRAILLIGDSYSDQSLYYKTHFLAADPFIYVENGNTSFLVTNAMERGRAEKESTAGEVRDFDAYGYRDLARELGDRNRAFTTMLTRIVDDLQVDRVLVQGTFPVLYADDLRAHGVQVDVDPRLLSGERRQKSESEIGAIEEAQRSTERAVAHAVEIIARSEAHGGSLVFEGIPLTSERLRAEIETMLIRDTMETSAGLIVAGGPGAADPHFEGEGALRSGEPIIIDVFPRSKRSRYFADMTRTVVKGDPGDLVRAMYAAVLRAQEAALGTIRAGVNGREVHEVVEGIFKEEGFAEETGPRYTHGTGHGVGLDIHEEPGIGSIDGVLLPGDVVTVEPGLYDPAVGGVRIEDLVVVTEEGCRNLTRFPKQLEV